MKDRKPVFDWIRTIAILGIISSHFFMFGGGGDSYEWFGRYLAGVFNVVFISLSAVLYGNKWRESGSNCFIMSTFLSKRWVKIASSLYPYLCMVMLIFLIFSIPIDVISFISNFLCIGWFSKLQYNGHLWFVTMIVICYITIAFVSRFPTLGKSKQIIIPFLLLAISLQIVTDSLGLPGYLFVFLCVYVVLFLWPLKNIRHISCFRKNALLFIFLTFNGFTVYGLSIGLIQPLSSVSYLLYSVCGYLWIVVMSLFLRFRTNSFVDWISKLSFEMYLVHHMLCTGPVSIISFDASPALNYIILIGITLVLAFFLHYLSQRIQQCFVC